MTRDHELWFPYLARTVARALLILELSRSLERAKRDSRITYQDVGHHLQRLIRLTCLSTCVCYLHTLTHHQPHPDRQNKHTCKIGGMAVHSFDSHRSSTSDVSMIRLI